MLKLDENTHTIKGLVLDRKERSAANPQGKRKNIELTFYNRRVGESEIKPYAATVKLAGQFFLHEGVTTLGALFKDYFSGRYYPSVASIDSGKHINLPDRLHKTFIISKEQTQREYDEASVPASEVDMIKNENIRLKKQIEILTKRLQNQAPDKPVKSAGTSSSSKSTK